MIDVKNFVAVAGIGGVQRLVSVRQNGLIIENLDTKVRKFVPVRSHEFSPFETISVYTNDESDTVPLAVLLTNMRDQLADNPLPSEKADSATLRAYFAAVLPSFDRDRVHVSDIKKALKWFSFLQSRDLLKDKIEETPTEEVAEAVETPENTEGGN